MTFALYDVVKNKNALPADAGGEVPAGSSGTVLEVYTKPAEAYEVEFADEEGRTIVMVALFEEDLLPG